MLESILQSVGRTPLVRLRRLTEGLQATSPLRSRAATRAGASRTGSALGMIADAERRGVLRTGGTIIEATAGNTGSGWPWSRRFKGYRASSSARQDGGREDRPPEGVRGPRWSSPRRPSPRTRRRATTGWPIGWPARSRAWRPNQFANMTNPEVHYRTTGPEIWEQTDAR